MCAEQLFVTRFTLNVCQSQRSNSSMSHAKSSILRPSSRKHFQLTIQDTAKIIASRAKLRDAHFRADAIIDAITSKKSHLLNPRLKSEHFVQPLSNSTRIFHRNSKFSCNSAKEKKLVSKLVLPNLSNATSTF